MQIINPFSDFGKIVQGDRFIGRKKEINQIQNRLLGKNFGNLAIIGLPRVGKSSLAHNALLVHFENLINDKIIVIWFNVGKVKTSRAFFEQLAFDGFNLLSEKFPDDLVSLKKKYQRLKEAELSEVEYTTYLQHFFRYVNSNGYRLIYILDEFDNTERIFCVEDFQLLRELSNDPSTQIALLTISRKTLRELEPENGALSNFYQIFSDLNLGFYSAEDLPRYWEFLKSHNIKVEDDSIDRIRYFTGAHPFLLDVINNEVFNYLENSSTNFLTILENIVDELRLKIKNEYQSIFNLIENEGLASKAIQIIVGPVYDVKQIDVERLLKYQLIVRKNDQYISFCDFFDEYLHILQIEIDVWPLWSETEYELRTIIKEFLSYKYGEEWVQKFLKDGSNKRKQHYIDGYEQLRQKNKKSFKERASDHLVDYTYPSDMMDCFISSDWSYFSKIFKKSISDWVPIFVHLSKIRNPLAHNNVYFLSDADKNIAVGYCQEIIRLISEWNFQKTM